MGYEIELGTLAALLVGVDAHCPSLGLSTKPPIPRPCPGYMPVFSQALLSHRKTLP